MPSPFPGMDPYLEHPDLWHEVHHGLISSIAYALAPQVRPKYRVAIEKRTYWVEVDEETCFARPNPSTVLRTGVAVLREQTAVAYAVAPAQPQTVRVPLFDEMRIVKNVARAWGLGTSSLTSASRFSRRR